MVSDGLLLSAQNPNGLSWVPYIVTIMYAHLVTMAWGLSNQNLCPFILDYSFDYGSGCPDVTYFDDFKSAKICYNNRLYFLLNAHGTSVDESKVFALLPGTGDLLAGAYGVTVGNIVRG